MAMSAISEKYRNKPDQRLSAGTLILLSTCARRPDDFAWTSGPPFLPSLEKYLNGRV